LTIIEALVLGIIQGITEFLPVSSSGHLVLIQKIFGIEAPVLLFDTLLHVATLTAVCGVLWRDIWDILKKIIQPMTFFIVIGTMPAVIAALLLSRQIEAAFAGASFLGFSFLITSIVLVTAETLGRKNGTNQTKEKKDMTWHDALFVGIMQAIAIIPGISRSGATLSAGLFRGLKRDFAVRFAFLLSIPAILGALVFQLKDLGKDGTAMNIGTAPLIAGTIAAAAVGFFSIKLMLKIVREKSLLGFAIYTGILGLLVIIDRFGTNIFF
jgi:undecaprenyl-diphosphatase